MLKQFRLFKLFRKFSILNLKTITSDGLVSKNNGSAWWIDVNLSNIYEDTNGTIKSHITGDEIGLLKSFGRFIKNATQSIGNLKPTLLLENNLKYLNFNNPNSYLSTEAVGDKAANFVLIGSGYTDKISNAIMLGCIEPTARSYIGINSNGYIGAGIDGVTYDSFFTEIKWDTPRVVTLIRKNHTAYLRVDGILRAEMHLTSGGSNLHMYIGAANNNGTPDKYWNGKIGFVSGMINTMTDLEILLLEKFAAKKIGITI